MKNRSLLEGFTHPEKQTRSHKVVSLVKDCRNTWGVPMHLESLPTKEIIRILQPVPADFDTKTKVTELLEKNGYDQKRARTMDIDDFLG